MMDHQRAGRFEALAMIGVALVALIAHLLT